MKKLGVLFLASIVAGLVLSGVAAGAGISPVSPLPTETFLPERPPIPTWMPTYTPPSPPTEPVVPVREATATPEATVTPDMSIPVFGRICDGVGGRTCVCFRDGSKWCVGW